MSIRKPLWIGIAVLPALSGAAGAADLPLKPAPPARSTAPAKPAATSPLAAPSATCQEWSDGCRTCQRQSSGEIACSNVGIACVPKDAQCVRA